MSNLIKIRPVGVELFLPGGGRDMQLMVAFRTFANAPEKTIFRERLLNTSICVTVRNSIESITPVSQGIL